MKTVKEILEAKAHNLLSVSPQASVLDALKLMAEKDIGARLRAQGDFARQILQGYAGERDHDAQGCVRAPRAERRGVYGADDRQAYPAPSRTGNQKVIGVISIGDVVKEVISEQRFVIEQLEQYIHSLGTSADAMLYLRDPMRHGAATQCGVGDPCVIQPDAW